ncbi:hypothetical protein [Marinobacterium sedimentorum]|uniref:hypothetical protein n=1 Tax=Marinobacterium sedimentorum TaxID=2927804 RepID=UPI0020C6ACA9|nr:hypothetical protein [Marinobacterium sedimentorum]MCP8687933.1 hypothetical protein [Marinobacterium sedimentorum]
MKMTDGRFLLLYIYLLTSSAGAPFFVGGAASPKPGLRGVPNKENYQNFFVGAVEMHFPAPINLNIQYLGQQMACCPFSVNNSFGS